MFVCVRVVINSCYSCYHPVIPVCYHPVIPVCYHWAGLSLDPCLSGMWDQQVSWWNRIEGKPWHCYGWNRSEGKPIAAGRHAGLAGVRRSARLSLLYHLTQIRKKKKLSETKTIMNCELRNTNPNVMYLCYFLTYCYFHLIIYSSYATPYCSDTLSLRQSPRSSGSLVEP